MSRTDDYGLQDTNREPQEHSHKVFDHAAEIASRAGLTREAAAHEMEKFLGVAEYETRKLVGQHSTLRQPDAPTLNEPKRQKRDERRTESPQTEKRAATPVPETPVQKEAIAAQPIAPEQSETTEGQD